MSPGVRMEPIRPVDAHRVTVLGSTLNIGATSPGVSSRSGFSIVTGDVQVCESTIYLALTAHGKWHYWVPMTSV